MDSLILLDRVTGLNVAIGFADGLITFEGSTDEAVPEPVIADQKVLKNWRLFVSDGIIGHEEVNEVAPGFIEIEDSITGVEWRFQVLDGVLGYIHILGISTTLESRVTEDNQDNSLGGDDAEIDSRVDQENEDDSLVEMAGSFNSKKETSINLNSKVG